jgi:protease IV
MQDKIDQQTLATDLVKQLIKEKRSERRWKNFRFFTWIILIVLGVMLLSSNNYVSLGPSDEKGYVAFIKLDGMIEPNGSFSAAEVLPRLKEAFSDTSAKGVILDINSGGGTPVQAAIMHDAIVNLKKKYHKKVIVVGEDMLASGAYYVAVGADKIYVNPNTITGSIGVIMKGFGFPDLIKKVGIERRVYTSGVNKDRLDPFLPQTKEDIEKITTVINEVHENFDQIVLEGRQGKLHAEPKDLFTGDFWSGQSALKLGLVDGLGNLTDVMSKEFHVSRYKDYSGEQSMLRSFASQFGASLSMALNDDGLKVLEKI